MRAKWLSAGLLSMAIMSAASPSQAEGPAVVASIAPVHSLVAGVMQGVGEPVLLVPPGASPHTFSLRPTDAQALKQADVIFYVGPNLEMFLDRPLETLAGEAVVADLQRVSGVTRLPPRMGGWWDEHRHDDDHDHDHEHEHDEHHGAVDGHLWLDPANAKAWVAHMAEVLSELDEANAATYRGNAQELADRLDGLTSELEEVLAGVRDVPYLVFHDAYQYFENRFGLNAIGSVVVNPESEAGVRRVSELRAKVGETGAACVFAEPQFEPGLIATVVEGTEARTGILDPIGSQIALGPDLYFSLLRQLAADLRDCLEP